METMVANAFGERVTDCRLANLFVRIFQLTPAVKLLQFPMAGNFSLRARHPSAPLNAQKEGNKKRDPRKSYNRTSYILAWGFIIW
jgi:hypothetical protein